MKYLCIGYFNQEKMESLPQAEIETLMSQCQPHLENLYSSGQVIMDVGTDSEVKSLQRVGGSVQVINSPFTTTKEVVGSVFIIEADAIEEAIRIASSHPTTKIEVGEHLGWRIDIRPIHYFKMFDQKD
ncbi:YciI family protein [Mesobacillus subterraneus]|uniref:YciI family protein n=1 Tax=Mesobacillus subterraneus TaxID=285983 RepID=UPI001CFC8CEF|nr:YciI family protein [Mesobacillus subterraneus]WLR56718.1 YciI family protein [Mesobacillus subterraneus]